MRGLLAGMMMAAAPPASAAPVTVNYVGNTLDTTPGTSGNSYSFTGTLNDPNTWIVCVVHITAGNETTGSWTIGGSAVTKLGGVNGGITRTEMAVKKFNPGGSVINVSIGFSSAPAEVVVSVWEITSEAADPFGTLVTTETTTVAVVADGASIAAATTQNEDDSVDPGADDYDFDMRSSEYASGAHRTHATSGNTTYASTVATGSVVAVAINPE